MKTFWRRVLDLEAARVRERGSLGQVLWECCDSDHELGVWFVIGWFVILYLCGWRGVVCLRYPVALVF
jgi:hypothetical protein